MSSSASSVRDRSRGGSGGVGSLLLLLSPVHREVTVLAKASPADPVLGDAGGLSGQGACHILRPQDSSLCHTPPLDWGRVMLSFLPWLPLHEILWGREHFLASSHHPRAPLRAQPSARFLASGARAAEPPWSEPLMTSLLPLSVGHLLGDFL